MLGLIVYEMRQDDPKKCTAAKLARLGLARRVRLSSALPKRGIVLNPYSLECLTPADSDTVMTAGLSAIDCSWRLADEVFRRRFRGIQRRLPTLLAGNPVNYARLNILTSAEALAAALYICQRKGEAQELLSVFKWGMTFLSLNRDPLEEYSKAADQADVLRIQEEYFRGRTGTIRETRPTRR